MSRGLPKRDVVVPCTWPTQPPGWVGGSDSKQKGDCGCMSSPHEIKREDDDSCLLPPPSSMKLQGKGHPVTMGPPFSHMQTDFRRFEEVTLPLLPPAPGLARREMGCGEQSKQRRGPREPLRAPGGRLRQHQHVEIPVRNSKGWWQRRNKG
jgi:hypothetical protein